jgi:hypothetical protein
MVHPAVEADIGSAGRSPGYGIESIPHVASSRLSCAISSNSQPAPFRLQPVRRETIYESLVVAVKTPSAGRQWPPSRWSRFNRNDTVTFLNPWRAGDSLAASHVALLCHVDSTAKGSWRLLILGVK